MQGMNTALRPRDLALALLVIVVWGLNFAVIKVGVADVPPMLLGALRYLLAAFPALLFVKPPKVPLRLYLLYGMTMAVGQFALLFTAIHIGMPSGLASLVLQAQAFFTLVFAALFLGEHWKANQLAGLVLAGAGLALIGSSHGQAMPLLGFALTVGAAAAWAGGNIVSRAVAKHGPINQLAFVVWSSLVPIGPFLALSWWFEGPNAMSAALAKEQLQYAVQIVRDVLPQSAGDTALIGAVVQAIAQAHGGRAQCLPGERGGALFELSWPA